MAATISFRHFLNIAGQYTGLITDLCKVQDIISRAQLLHYLESHGIPPAEKDGLIKILCRVLVLFEEAEDGYTVNPAVADLVNYYERRGRLTSARFLRDQILGIARLTEELQHRLFADEVDKNALFDTIDDLYRLVKEVREYGSNHYQACMVLLGDMKRTGNGKTVDQRLAELETVQRRHIHPLRELVDPNAEYAQKITQLKHRIADLGSNTLLLAQSQELAQRRRRLILDLQYIDHVLLRQFGIITATALTMLQSLMEEKRIKDAVAACLGNLDAVWTHTEEQTLISPGRQSSQFSGEDRLETFFAEVVHRKLLPNPQPLLAPEVQPESVETVFIRPEQIWAQIERAQEIKSWPAFVLSHFTDYPARRQLGAMTLPLLSPHPAVELTLHQTQYRCRFADFTVDLLDFGLIWSEK